MHKRSWIAALLVVVLASACSTLDQDAHLDAQRAVECDESWTYTGDLVVTSSNVDEYLSLTAIEGNLLVVDTDLVVLDAFPCLRTVSRSVAIADNELLKRVDGFESLTNAAGLFIERNAALRAMHGFNALDTVLTFVIKENPALSAINAFDSLRETGDDVSSPGFEILENDSLRIIKGFNALELSRASFKIEDNDALKKIDGFNDLQLVIWDFSIKQNPLLERMQGFESLRYAANQSQSYFRISANPLIEIPGFESLEFAGGGGFWISGTSLPDISGFNTLTRVGADGGLSIGGNSELVDISGFSSLRDAYGGFSIESNLNLQQITGFDALVSVPYGDMTILNNSALVTIDSFYEVTTVEERLTLSDVRLMCPSFQKLTSGVSGGITLNGTAATLPLPCESPS